MRKSDTQIEKFRMTHAHFVATGSADFIDGRAKISAGKKRHALLVVS